MNKSHSLEVNKLIHSIGLKYGLRDVTVKNMIESQFRFAYETIQKLELDNQSKEEIEQTKTNFIFKHLGKLHTSPTRVEGFKNRIKNYGKKNKSDIGEHSDSNEGSGMEA